MHGGVKYAGISLPAPPPSIPVISAPSFILASPYLPLTSSLCISFSSIFRVFSAGGSGTHLPASFFPAFPKLPPLVSPLSPPRCASASPQLPPLTSSLCISFPPASPSHLLAVHQLIQHLQRLFGRGVGVKVRDVGPRCQCLRQARLQPDGGGGGCGLAVRQRPWTEAMETLQAGGGAVERGGGSTQPGPGSGSPGPTGSNAGSY